MGKDAFDDRSTLFSRSTEDCKCLAHCGLRVDWCRLVTIAGYVGD